MAFGVPGLSGAVFPNPQVTSFPVVSSFTISGAPVPGKWTLLEAPKKFGWQIQQGFGLSGAFVIPKGDELIVPKFKGEFWAQTEYAAYREVRKRLLDKGVISLGGLATALGIYHPELHAMGCTSVVVLELNPIVDAGKGLWTTTTTFLQYRPPKLTVARPNQTTPDVPAANTTAKNNQEVETQKLLAQNAALFAKLKP